MVINGFRPCRDGFLRLSTSLLFRRREPSGGVILIEVGDEGADVSGVFFEVGHAQTVRQAGQRLQIAALDLSAQKTSEVFDETLCFHRSGEK